MINKKNMEPFLEGKELNNFKIIFIGASKTGKTAIINKYINNIFIENYFPTSEIV